MEEKLLKLQGQLQSHEVPEMLRHIANREVPEPPGLRRKTEEPGATLGRLGVGGPGGREWASGTTGEV